MVATSPADPGASRIGVVETRRLDGHLDRDILDRAFAWVVRRHDALRLVFDTVSLDPTVRVLTDFTPAVEYVDTAGLPPAQRDSLVNRSLFQHCRRTYDLFRGPLWQALLVRLAHDSHLMSVAMSHIIADGYSSTVFFNDLFRAYAALCDGRPLVEPPAPSIHDIHAAQLASYRRAEERLDYWRRLIPVHSFPPAFTLSPTGSEVDYLRNRLVDIVIPEQSARGLRRTAWRVGATPFVALMAAYHAVLGAITGKERTVVATAGFGRSTASYRSAVFQFATYPYVSVPVGDQDDLLQLVGATRHALSEALTQSVSYTSLARAVNPDFDALRPWPAANFVDGGMYSWAPDPHDIRLPELTVRSVEISVASPPGYTSEYTSAAFPQGHPQVWIARGEPSIAVSSDRRRVIVAYNDELFPSAEVEAFCVGVRWVVDQVAHRATLPMAEVRRTLSAILADGQR